MKAVLSRKGQVTIPKQLRDRLGLQPGQILDFEKQGGRLIVSKVLTEDPIESVYGILNLGISPDALLEELRGPVGIAILDPTE